MGGIRRSAKSYRNRGWRSGIGWLEYLDTKAPPFELNIADGTTWKL